MKSEGWRQILPVRNRSEKILFFQSMLFNHAFLVDTFIFLLVLQSTYSVCCFVLFVFFIFKHNTLATYTHLLGNVSFTVYVILFQYFSELWNRTVVAHRFPEKSGCWRSLPSCCNQAFYRTLSTGYVYVSVTTSKIWEYLPSKWAASKYTAHKVVSVLRDRQMLQKNQLRVYRTKLEFKEG